MESTNTPTQETQETQDKILIEFSLDIETLGLKPGAVVTEIGICNNHTADELHIYLPINPQRQLGMMIDKETAKWHEDNNPNFDTMLKACQSIDQTQVELIQNLGCLESHIKEITGDNDVCFWMNSPNFDAVLLEVVYDLIGMKYPWTYRQLRCLRTIRDLANLTYDHPAMPEKPKDAHDALVDAKYQLEIVNVCHNHINVVPF